MSTTFKSKAKSPARAKLQECIEAHASVAAEMIPLRESIAKLASQSEAVPDAEAAIERLNAKDDHSALLWARGEGEQPAPDIEARDRLARELAAARASAASAARASAVIAAQIDQVAGRAPDIEKFKTSAIAEILVEEAEPLLASIQAEAISLAVQIKLLQYVGIRAADLARAGASGDVIGVVGNLVERSKPADWQRVADAIHLATESFPAVLDKQKEAIDSWRQFESDVRSDSGVHFAGAK
jgi:hypothetical protein